MLQFISNFTSKRRRNGLKDWAHSYSQSKNYAEKVRSRKICVTLFRKSKRLWLDSKQNEWLSKSSLSKGFYKKSVLIYIPKFTRKHLYRSLFLIKLDALDLELHLKWDLSADSIWKFCELCKNTLFAEHHRSTFSG